MKNNDDILVTFQGRKVKKAYRDAYMDGYRHPYAPNPHGKYSKAKEAGQTAGRQDACLEGTF